jgi:hypothetical protein
MNYESKKKLSFDFITTKDVHVRQEISLDFK